jgi:hypothetical protein
MFNLIIVLSTMFRSVLYYDYKGKTLLTEEWVSFFHLHRNCLSVKDQRKRNKKIIEKYISVTLYLK